MRLKNKKQKTKKRSSKALSSKLRSSRGFTLLLATLVASLMMALGLAMFSIAQKEVRLSSIGRDSQFAFYAADTGVECALYLHYVHDAFATFTTFTNADIAKCDSQAIIDPSGVNNPTHLGGGDETIFKYDLQGVNPSGGVKPYCVSVKVEKRSTYPHTRISSLGYNVSCDARSLSNRVLERAVHMDL